jgi:hypothetical protein
VSERHVGYTGTSSELTDAADAALAGYLLGLKSSGIDVVGHHGDCVGGDARFDFLCRVLRFRVVVHPPSDPKKRAWCHGLDHEIREPKDYRARNEDIVEECEELVGNLSRPGFDFYRSGEWMTLNIARRLGRPRVMIDSEGDIQAVPEGV